MKDRHVYTSKKHNKQMLQNDEPSLTTKNIGKKPYYKMTTLKDHHIYKHVLLENPGARPLVEIQNDLGFQVSSGLKANHSVVVISWGIVQGGYENHRMDPNRSLMD